MVTFKFVCRKRLYAVNWALFVDGNLSGEGWMYQSDFEIFKASIIDGVNRWQDNETKVEFEYTDAHPAYLEGG